MNSLDLARDRFAALTTGPHPPTVDGTLFPGLPAKPLPLDEVRDLLLTRQCPQATSDAVWTYLVKRARTRQQTWTEAALGIALPALTATAAHLARRCPGDPADLHAELVCGFLQAIHTIDLTKPRIMLRLRWAAYRAGHAIITQTLAKRTQHSRWVDQPAKPSGHPDFLLADAVNAGILKQSETELIGTTRLESVSIAQWAAEHNTTTWAAYKARRRAEIRLIAHLNNPEDHTTAQKPNIRLSKTDPEFGLQTGGELPQQRTTSPEMRPCA
jgi:hypothetical protein